MLKTNLSIKILILIIPLLSVFGFQLLMLYQSSSFFSFLIIIPFIIILCFTFLSLNLNLREVLYFFVLHAVVYLLVAQLPREYIHIYTFSLLGAHLEKQFSKNVKINIIIGALISYFDEFIQIYVPSRFFDLNDILLNFVSFICGVLFIRLFVR